MLWTILAIVLVLWLLGLIGEHRRRAHPPAADAWRRSSIAQNSSVTAVGRSSARERLHPEVADGVALRERVGGVDDVAREAGDPARSR